jgi:hypothetical protein
MIANLMIKDVMTGIAAETLDDILYPHSKAATRIMADAKNYLTNKKCLRFFLLGCFRLLDLFKDFRCMRGGWRGGSSLDFRKASTTEVRATRVATPFQAGSRKICKMTCKIN